MKLTFTHYIAADPASVAERLDDAVVAGLDAAADRTRSPRRDTVTTATDAGLHVDGGVDSLAGTHLTFVGADRFTEVRVEIPWSQVDAGTTKLWAANRFAGVVADRLAA